MNILIISYLYKPDVCGGSPIFADLAEELGNRGHNVTVRTAYSFYPEWVDKTGENGIHISSKYDHGVWVERYGLYIPSNPKSLPQRALYEASRFFSLSRSLFKNRKYSLSGPYDVGMCFCPLIGDVAFGALFKTIHGTPMLLDVEDLPAGAASSSGIIKRKWLGKLASKIQSGLFKRFDSYRAISPVMQAEIAKIACPKKVNVIPHWLHTSLAEAIKRLPDKMTPPKPYLKDPYHLLYSGNIGLKQGLRELIVSLGNVTTPFEFTIRGAGGGVPGIADWLTHFPDPRITLASLSNEEGLARALYNANIYVICEKPGSSASYFPSKLIPAIASGTPILAVCDSESPLGTEVNDHGLGVQVGWDAVHRLLPDNNGLDGAIQQCVDPDKWAQYHSNCLNRAKYYDRTRCIDELEQVLTSLSRKIK